MFTIGVVTKLIDSIDACPWGTASGRQIARTRRQPLYTVEERSRRDATPWTMVQGVLAPVQFGVFLVSLGLVLNYLATRTLGLPRSY